jgi:hypothetical protein
MKKESSKIISRFHLYQKERFPIIVLAISLFPAILSSGVVVSSHPNIVKATMALIAAIAYLLHIRVIDEHRDFNHDSVHHVDRPVQVGLISRGELRKIDFFAICVLLVVAIFSGVYATLIAIIMLCYSYLAEREFFLGEKAHRHFFFYNSINLVQMLLMQVFVYFIFTNVLSLTALLVTHFLFTTTGTIIFEFMRKLKIPGEDGTGKDTYTFHLGFNNSIIIYLALAVVNISLFARISGLISARPFTWLISSYFLAMIVAFFALVHWVKKIKITDQLLQLSFLLCYGILNLIIYFIKI